MIYRSKRRLEEYLKNGYHGRYDLAEKNKERRSHPSNIWQDAKTVISIQKLWPQGNPLHNIKETLKTNISVYARADDIMN